MLKTILACRVSLSGGQSYVIFFNAGMEVDWGAVCFTREGLKKKSIKNEEEKNPSVRLS